jgi:hypothetical protein
MTCRVSVNVGMEVYPCHDIFGSAGIAGALQARARVDYPSTKLGNVKDLKVDEPLDITYPDDGSPVEADAEAAKAALAMDNEIDDLYQQVQRELLTYMMEDPHTIGRATKLLNVGRYLERLGDHLENVNEHIIFWLTGERI